VGKIFWLVPGKLEKRSPGLKPSHLVMTMWLPALRAYADGFVSSLIGGLIYCLILARFHPAALDSAWWRVLAGALACGCIELWRVSRRRQLRGHGAWVLWALTVSLFAIWAAGAVIATRDGPSEESARQFLRADRILTAVPLADAQLRPSAGI